MERTSPAGENDIRDELFPPMVFLIKSIVGNFLSEDGTLTTIERNRKVISMEDWVRIKKLKAKKPKMSLRKIEGLIGVSHHTVKSALKPA